MYSNSRSNIEKSITEVLVQNSLVQNSSTEETIDTEERRGEFVLS